MQNLGRSLIDTNSLSIKQIEDLFSLSDQFGENFKRTRKFLSPKEKKIVCCVFFEPSTRTRMSFQIAAERLGMSVVVMESSSSSLVKGESLSDTIHNLAAMTPDALVVRYGQSPDLDRLLPQLAMPVINAGSGVSAHPTQGLLDAYTISKERGKIKGEKVLIIGDIVHSRVARSNYDILLKLGAEIAFCGPENFLPSKDEFGGTQNFTHLKEALEWCTVCMGLRIQLERHDAADLNSLSVDDYHSQFGLNARTLQFLKPDAVIMHPGPINVGVEFSKEVLKDSRARILTQVSNGVLIRAAVLATLTRLT